jgi:Fic family protein
MSPRRLPRAAIHKRLEFEVSELRTRFGGLPAPAEAEDIWTDIWYSEVHSSTAIEGNTLALREVAVLLAHGQAVGNRPLKDYLEVKGYADAARWVYEQGLAAGELMTLNDVRQLHHQVMSPVWQVEPHPYAHDAEGPGSWRQHNIQQFSGGMKPPEFTDVPMLMSDWVADVNRVRGADGPIAENVARLHYEFERIHPFIDGNGRTGRLLANLILVRLGYPPAIVHKRQREVYLDALREADRGELGRLGELFAEAIIENLTKFILPAIAGPARLVPLESLVTRELNLAALRKAAQRGRLRAIRTPAGTWQSTRLWVEAYKKSRYDTLREPRASYRVAAATSR